MKKGFAFLLCLAILAALALPAAAEQHTGFLHPLTKTEGSFLCLAGAPLNGGSVSAAANGQNVDCTVTTVREAELPVTYYCIVDQSSALSDSQRNQQKRALTALNSALRPVDTMVLILMGESLVCGEPLTDAESRQQAIDLACDYQARFTDLNASIVSTVQQVTASQNDSGLSCILLITDGLDDAHVPVSQESLYQTIQSSGLSLCTLSLVDPWAGAYGWYHARRMEEYAAQSVGGIGVIPSRDYDAPTCVEDSVGEIVETILSGSVVQLPLSQLPGGSGMELEVTWSRDGKSIAEKRIVDTVPPAAPTEAPQPEPLPDAQPEPLPDAQPEPLPDGAPETQPVTAPEPVTEAAVPSPPPAADSNIGNMILCLVLAGFVLVILLVVLAVVLWRKQRALEREPEVNPAPSRNDLVMPDLEKDWEMPSLEDLKNRLEPKKDAPKASPVKETPTALAAATPGCRVRLVPENHPEGATEFTIGVNESVTLGRSEKSDIVLNETDRALSSLHFELQWDSRALYLRDRKSTNGTALNGVPLRPEFWTRVEKKAVIQAGSTRYTVLTEKK